MMECHNCESRQRQFYCENCIRAQYVASDCSSATLLIHRDTPQSLRDFRLQIQHAAVDRDEQVRKAAAAIDTITDSRLRRADLSLGQERLDELNEGLANLRRENDRGQSVSWSACPPDAGTLGY
jgi:autophagy-related ATG14-like protein